MWFFFSCVGDWVIFCFLDLINNDFGALGAKIFFFKEIVNGKSLHPLPWAKNNIKARHWDYLLENCYLNNCNMVYSASLSSGVPIRKDVQHEVKWEPSVTWAGLWRQKFGQM